MSLAPAANDLIQVKPLYSVDGQATAMNVLHYRVASLSGTPPDVFTFNSEIGKAWITINGPLWSNFSSNQVSMPTVQVTNVFPLPRSHGINYSPATLITGLLNDQALPAQNAPTILKRTNYGDRGGLGRLYVVGVSEGGQDKGRLTPAIATAVQAWADSLDDNLTVTATGWSAVLQPVLVKGPEDNPVRIATVVDMALSNDVLKSQKRRRPGKGI